MAVEMLWSSSSARANLVAAVCALDAGDEGAARAAIRALGDEAGGAQKEVLAERLRAN